MVHKLSDNEFVVSSYNVWRNGVFDSERAAEYSVRFPEEEILKLQEANPEKTISYEDLLSIKSILNKK